MAKGLRSSNRKQASRLKAKRLAKWEAQKLSAVVKQLKNSVEGSNIDPDVLESLEVQAQKLVAAGQSVRVTIEDDPQSAESSSPAPAKPSERGIQKKVPSMKTRQAIRLESHQPSNRKKQPSI